MKPRPHQIEGAEWVLSTLRKYGLAYLAWQERSGKSLTALLTVENSKAKRCLILTKKKAINGWEETLKMFPHSKKYVVGNYESAHKLTEEFDLIILDEAHHAISGFPRPSKTWKTVRKLTKGKALLYLSATPYAENLGLIYHQLKLSDWSPFKSYRNFYEWFRMYGINKMVRTPYGLIETYSKYKDELILKEVEHLFNFKTRSDVGIEYEPAFQLIKVPLSDKSKKLIEELLKDEMVVINGQEIVCDSPMKKAIVHYQLELGAVRNNNGCIYLNTDEKANYIKEHYDPEQTVIMAHFICERDRLKQVLPDFTILSAESYSEGIDLSHIDKLVFTSTSFKTSKFTQRLSRQANHKRNKPIVVDILYCDKPAIGLKVVDAVALKKENFDKNSYERYAI